VNKRQTGLFDTVLIANRGEIACRIMRACQALGLSTVAVYSEADKNALHTKLADQAFCIGPAPATESYLNIPAILKVATESGAQAIHPGYGFLAEKPELAQACAEAGLVFIGPSAEVLEKLGAKTAARALAQSLQIPVVPGKEINPGDPQNCQKMAAELGYPLLVKAVGGGGGRGMRKIAHESELLPALMSAAAEAQKAFSDDRLYLEKWLSPVRHIEFQILGDSQGQVIHLGERECSLQRRYQKIWEEAPALNLSPALRADMGNAAVRIGQSLAYLGAGTVEFILDAHDQFYFLEVNARIQVEHPVTELVTGLDLVQLQLQMAAGQPLPLKQAQIQLQGHAIEVRVCAEDTTQNFGPASGPVGLWQAPQQTRCDSGIATGSEISIYYDSMLAKVIVHGQDRAQALLKLRQALKQTVALGLSTNLNYLQELSQAQAIITGKVHTGWLEAHPELGHGPSQAPAPFLVAATLWRCLARPSDPLYQAGLPRGWRNNPFSPQREHWQFKQQPLTLAYHQIGPQKWLWGQEQETIETIFTEVYLLEHSAQSLRFEWNNRQYICHIWQNNSEIWLHNPNWGNLCIEALPRLRWPQAQVQAGDFCASQPGKVLQIAVSPGQKVAEGEILLVLESMKMETSLNAPHAGIVREVCVEPHQQVSTGQKLLELQALES
jgi:acetyl/propionyl-CoA carboxylase alpha subunit